MEENLLLVRGFLESLTLFAVRTLPAPRWSLPGWCTYGAVVWDVQQPLFTSAEPKGDSARLQLGSLCISKSKMYSPKTL